MGGINNNHVWDSTGSRWIPCKSDTSGNTIAVNPDGTYIGSITATTVSGSAAANGAYSVTAIDVSAYRSISLQVTGTFTAAHSFECSNDNTTWVACPLQNVASVPLAENTSASSSTGLYAGNINYKYFRARVTSYTSGTITTTLVLSTLFSSLPTQPVWAGQDGTWTVQPGNTPNTSPWLVSVVPAFTNTRVTADGQIRSSSGKIHSISLAPTTATPTAGLITIYDSLTESGTIIYSEWFAATTVGHTIIIDSTVSNGIYVGYDATAANISVSVSHSS